MRSSANRSVVIVQSMERVRNGGATFESNEKIPVIHLMVEAKIRRHQQPSLTRFVDKAIKKKISEAKKLQSEILSKDRCFVIMTNCDEIHGNVSVNGGASRNTRNRCCRRF